MAQMACIREWGGRFVVPIAGSAGIAMIFIETPLLGAYIIELERHHDARGFFARVWCQHEWEARGLNSRLVQCNISFNTQRSTLRGVRLAARPICRSQTGALYDGRDLRCDYRSPPRSRSRLNNRIPRFSRPKRVPCSMCPRGVPTAFFTLVDRTEVFYQILVYHPDSQTGVRSEMIHFWHPVDRRGPSDVAPRPALPGFYGIEEGELWWIFLSTRPILTH